MKSMDDKIKQILEDILNNLNDSKYELENLEVANEKIKKRIENILELINEAIEEIEELLL